MREINTFRGTKKLSDCKRILAHEHLLVDDGYAKKLIVANDICLKASLRKYGGWGYDHIFENIVPMMRQEKMSEADIKTIVDDNPIDFLKQE